MWSNHFELVFLFYFRCYPCESDLVCMRAEIRRYISQASACNGFEVTLTFHSSAYFLSSPRVHWGAGLFLHLEGTLGGCTWQPHSLPCWSLSWYLWTSRSLLWLSTGKSTNSRLVHRLKVLFILKILGYNEWSQGYNCTIEFMKKKGCRQEFKNINAQ